MILTKYNVHRVTHKMTWDVICKPIIAFYRANETAGSGVVVNVAWLVSGAGDTIIIITMLLPQNNRTGRVGR